jgi:carbonic anhydrase
MPQIPNDQPSIDDPSRAPGQGLTKEQALLRLLEGHWRYLANEKRIRVFTEMDRIKHAEAQFPFAVILGCADSRVAPEIIFDQGLGDLFVARVAGNIAGTGEIASIEYAIEFLGVKLIVVLGHQNCGAVNAALGTDHPPGLIEFLISEISPAVEEARKCTTGSLLDNAVAANVRRCAEMLVVRSECISKRVDSGNVRIVGAVYRLNTGDVDINHVIG